MIAIVTGATGGIGQALLPLLVDAGYRVYAAQHATAGAARDGVTWFDGWDVPDVERIDALIHCAGVCELGPLAEVSEEEWRRAMDVNVIRPALMTSAALPLLRGAGGHVIYVNSGSGLTAKAQWGTYCASKFAAKAWCDTLRQEEPDIRVTSIHPGRINTGMQERIVAKEGGVYDGSRYIQPATVAQAIIHALEMTRDATPTEIMIRPR